jgi:endoglucanase
MRLRDEEKMTLENLTEKFTAIPGPSGSEEKIRAAIQAEIAPFVDEVRTDALGNLIARKNAVKSQKTPLKLMLTAHIDEIGVIVTHVDEHGFARFTNLGGLNPQTLVGNRVLFMNGVRGLINVEKLEKPNLLPALEQLYIDTGAPDLAGSKVKVGDVAAIDEPFTKFGSRWVSKALDDRIGVALLVDLIRQVKTNVYDLYFVFAVQEEPGYRGSGPAAYAVDPDLGLAIDVTAVGDTPKGIKMEVALGAGPAVKIRDSRMIADQRVVRWMSETAEANKIPCQREILLMGGTDANQIQTSRSGVPSGCLSVPCRYVHSHSEMADAQDVADSAKLLLKLCETPINLEY